MKTAEKRSNKGPPPLAPTKIKAPPENTTHGKLLEAPTEFSKKQDQSNLEKTSAAPTGEKNVETLQQDQSI